MARRPSLLRWSVLASTWLVPSCLLIQPLDEPVPDLADAGHDATGGDDPTGTGGSSANAGNAGNAGNGAIVGNAGNGAIAGNEPSAAGQGTGGTAGAGTGAVSGEGGSDGSAGVPGGGSPVWALWPMPNPASTGLPNPHRYRRSVVAGDVTVVDLVTNLTWEHHDNGVFTARDQAGAQAYCDSSVLGGYDDWRLPTIIELVSIVDFTRNAPAIDPIAFVGTPPFAYFFAATPGLGQNSNWSVSSSDGITAIFDPIFNPASETLARCVR